MKSRFTTILVISAVAFALIQMAGCATGKAELDVGQKAYWTKDYKTALIKFREAADAGNAKAQWWLSMMYSDGTGINKDEAEAIKWARLSAEQDYAPAQVSMGLRYLSGNHVSKDPTKAADWLRKAADQGAGTALVALGFMHARGEGVEKDAGEALKYFRLAKDSGFNVPDEYLTEEGITKIKTIPSE